MDKLILGDNFFTLSNHNFMSVYGSVLEEILLLSVMSGYDVVFTTSRKNIGYVSVSPMIKKKIQSANSHDMIHIKQKHDSQTLFYLTLTYNTVLRSFCEFGLNPMNDKIQKVVQQSTFNGDVRHSRYFYATTDFNEVRKVLDCALEIAKNI